MRDPCSFAFVSTTLASRVRNHVVAPSNNAAMKFDDIVKSSICPFDPLTSTATMTLSSTSLSIAAEVPTTLIESSAPVGVYEAVMPSTETLVGMGFIVILCIVVSYVWANQVVPTSRTNLAISKSRGEVKDYLDQLKESDPSMGEASSTMNKTDTTIGSIREEGAVTDENVEEEKLSTVDSSTAKKMDNRAFERWLFTDWLVDNKSDRKAGRQKEAALPILKDAKWNSGDNPILVATALISLGVLFTALTERIVSM